METYNTYSYYPAQMPEELLTYFPNLLKNAGISDSVVIEMISQMKGKGMRCVKPIPKDAVILREKPLVSLQHATNRMAAKTCGNCFKFLGSLEQQFQIHLDYIQMEQPKGFGLGPTGPLTQITCLGGCGETYCSEDCRNESWKRHHRFLCVGPINDITHPLLLFKKHAILHSEVFLQAAQIISIIISEWQSNGRDLQKAMLPFAVYHKKIWWEAYKSDESVTTESLQKLATESLGFLREAFKPLIEIEEKQIGKVPEIANLFTMEFWSLLLGLIELNNNSIEFASPLQKFLQNLPNMPEPGRSTYWKILEPVIARTMDLQDTEDIEEEHEHDEDEMIEEEQHDDDHHHKEEDKIEEDDDDDKSIPKILKQALNRKYVFTPFQGMGLFPISGSMNHSCVPNTIVKFDSDYESMLVSLNDINVGDEMTHSYIDDDIDDTKSRQSDLLFYGFICDCPKCSK